MATTTETVAMTLTDPKLVAARQAGLQKLIDNNNKSIDKLEDRVSLTEARLRARYTLLDTQMSKLNNLSSYVTTQMAKLNSE